MVRAAVAASALLLVAAACGGASTAGCRDLDEPVYGSIDEPLAIEAAREHDGSLVVARGILVLDDNRPTDLCTYPVSTDPPECDEHSFEIVGHPGPAVMWEGPRKPELDGIYGEGRAFGRVDGGTLRFQLGCRTHDVQAFMEEATGFRPEYNPLGSGLSQELLEFAPPSRPEAAPAELRERYGTFFIWTKTLDDGVPLLDGELDDDQRGVGRVYWREEGDGDFWAVKRYHPDVAVTWLAGKAPRLDERWRRLDTLLRTLPHGAAEACR